MDRGTLLLVALAMLCIAGIVLGAAGITLFRRDRHAAGEATGTDGAREEPLEEGS